MPGCSSSASQHRADARQPQGQARAETGRRRVSVQVQHGNASLRRADLRCAFLLAQPPYDDAGDRLHHLRVPGHDFVEDLGRHAYQVAVAHRLDGCAARLVGQQCDLADALAAPHLAHHTAVARHRAQASAEDEVHVAARIPLREECLAGMQPHPLHARFQVLEQVLLHLPEQARETRHELVAKDASAHAFGHLPDRLGRLAGDAFEGLERDADQHDVRHCRDRRPVDAGPAQACHLAGNVATMKRRQRGFAAIRADRRRAQQPRRHDVQRMRALTAAKQYLPGVQVHRFEAAGRQREERVVKRGKPIRDAFEQLRNFGSFARHRRRHRRRHRVNGSIFQRCVCRGPRPVRHGSAGGAASLARLDEGCEATGLVSEEQRE
jgi:hypothetical protein